MDKPTLTKKQIKEGFHIWTEFEHQDKPTKMINGKRVRPPLVIGFKHWKKCPCGRDIRLK